MASLNQVELIGNLGRDPETRKTKKDEDVVTFSMATSDKWTDKNTGEVREQTEWHRVVIFQPGAVTFAQKFLKKGSRVYVQGRLRTQEWTDKENIKRRTTEVVLTMFGGRLIGLSDPGGERAPEAPAPDSLDDEIPF